jgi:hypothetical protein
MFIPILIILSIGVAVYLMVSGKRKMESANESDASSGKTMYYWSFLIFGVAGILIIAGIIIYLNSRKK